jgi:hypothetical protein
MAEYADTLKKLNLKQRRLLKIDNPLLPKDNPPFNKAWLYDPTR